nr:reverse transcriptase domain-containing protein [Tanacetum cinerariifolium]
MIVRSLSPYNGIIGMLKFLVEGGIVTICSTVLIPTECTSVITSSAEVAIGGTLSDKGRTKLCSILKKNLDIFAWQQSDMTGLPRLVVEHQLNIREGYSPVWQKKWGQAPERAKAIQAERLMEKVFESQIGQNIEVYVNDLVVKSYKEAKMIRDIEETFRTLRKVNMKLNPKKCAFGLAKGMFLGYVVTLEGIKPCLDKTVAVLQQPSPRTIKEVQSLNGKLASLNRFLSKSAEKYLPLFQTLKKSIKMSDFYWTAEVEQVFKQLKHHLSELPLLVAPKPKEELIIYLSTTYEAISSVLMTERGMALIAGLQIAARMGVKNLHVSVDSKLVANHVLGTYVAKEDNMIEYLEIVKNLVLVEVLKDKSIKEKEVATVIEEDGPTWMTPMVDYLKEGTLPGDKKEARKLCLKAQQYALMEGILYRRSFLTSWLTCVGPLQAEYVIREIHEGSCSMHAGPRPGKVKFLIVAMDYFTKWIEAKAVATITGGQVKKFIWDNIVCRFGISGEIVSDNEIQFSDNPFKDWCDKINITQWFASVKHPQSNGLVERANRSLGEGIKSRLVIPIEIEMPTYRTAAVDVVSNDEELRLNLDMLKERRERAAICKANAKSKMLKYYNARVRDVTFRPGEFVYRSNDASHTVAGRKLGLKWEGPYEVTEALGDGAYKLWSMDGTILLRTWNTANLK